MSSRPTHDCRTFRGALERLLRGRAAPDELATLGWDAHLLSCGECRALLEAEEALEALLASLPAPSLPPELTERVLARLTRAQASVSDDRLDALLDHDAAPEVPRDLTARVLAGVRPDRSVQPVRAESLDALLERLPAPSAPADLAARTLAGLDEERLAATRRARVRALPGGRRAAAAAALVVALGGGAFWLATRGDGAEPGPSVVAEEVPEELLAELDLFTEDWELLMADDLDAFLGTLPEEERLWLAAFDAAEAVDTEEGEDG